MAKALTMPSVSIPVVLGAGTRLFDDARYLQTAFSMAASPIWVASAETPQPSLEGSPSSGREDLRERPVDSGAESFLARTASSQIEAED